MSPALASEILVKHNLELNGKSDKGFVDGIYKLARDMLTYVPKLTKDQFFQTSFATQKCQMTIDLIRLIQQKCKSFQTSEKTAASSGPGVSNDLGGREKALGVSSSMYSLNLKSNVVNGSCSSNASSSSSSSISSMLGNGYNAAEQQNELKVSRKACKLTAFSVVHWKMYSL